MEFYVVPALKMSPPSKRNVAYLEIDNWNDWGKYRTQYFLAYINASGKTIRIGSLKIGEKGLIGDRPKIPSNFTRLGRHFFSVGQSREYYESLMNLDPDVRTEILVSLRDIVHDSKLFEQYSLEDVMQRSLLRDFSSVLIDGQFRRILQGRSPLTEFDFTFTRPLNPSSQGASLILTFSVRPGSNPPSNVHALIGRNGVGKTDLLSRMVRRLVRPSEPELTGQFTYFRRNLSYGQEKGIFANLVVVAFSVFDPFSEITKEESATVGYIYIGLDPKESSDPDKRPLEVVRNSFPAQFVEGVEKCIKNNSIGRLIKAFKRLESDRLLSEWNLPTLLFTESPDDDWRSTLRHAFSRLSSGHKVVCLTLSQLIASVAERSLVLIDEPESHLHPPLLSAFIRSLSELLIEQNGVGVISTHSPVVLQEIPKECVWIIDRSGDAVVAARPEPETFGENVSNLTRDVFQLEVREAGFHRLIYAAANKFASYEEALASFQGQLGSEARVILRGLFETRKRSE